MKEEIKKLIISGKTHLEVSKLFNISRQRVGQIVNNELGGGNGRDRIREQVRKRDNYTCQICKKIWVVGERRFDVHHLDEEMYGKNRSKLITRYDKNNKDRLITYCHKCHLTFHWNKANKK